MSQVSHQLVTGMKILVASAQFSVALAIWSQFRGKKIGSRNHYFPIEIIFFIFS